MSEFDVTVQDNFKGEKIVHLDLGILDGGDHGRDIEDWRNLTPTQALALGNNLLKAAKEIINPKEPIHYCSWCQQALDPWQFGDIIADRFIHFKDEKNWKAYNQAETELGWTSYFHKDCKGHKGELIRRIETRYHQILEENDLDTKEKHQFNV